ncbi:maleylpyruvate isomerase N-terminal domain-containing protein [Actinomycetospora straminea]|uniref:Mycothiol-dependent maleylpyruvate isomerase metal-binding domain-containing protein n=1 Tax=Actinomycetospora straminea TaxID=663607 RepID=A0ABP9EKX1_9PSEU|nr:maleylpyruvate isomerase N-terminal domain-containing protein [Actinomycetospora straminea]MDD7933855.1 maleylpyruvate isomerase N-terminal domain-containing protein [Actinomycetospora straminea]
MDARGPAIDARPALRRDRARFLELLRVLTPDDWHRPTVCGPWLVRDVVAHVLGDDLSRLSRSRDRYDRSGGGPSGGSSLYALRG